MYHPSYMGVSVYMGVHVCLPPRRTIMARSTPIIGGYIITRDKTLIRSPLTKEIYMRVPVSLTPLYKTPGWKCNSTLTQSSTRVMGVITHPIWNQGSLYGSTCLFNISVQNVRWIMGVKPLPSWNSSTDRYQNSQPLSTYRGAHKSQVKAVGV